MIKNTSCVLLTADQLMPPSPDGSYTPPAPDATLLRAVDRASQEDYNRFCESWDPVTGFPDRMTYNEDGDCGTWQTDYMQLHELRLEQLERLKAGDFESFVHQEHPGYVSYLCKEDPTNRASRSCGGLADRMSGKNREWKAKELALIFSNRHGFHLFICSADRSCLLGPLARWQSHPFGSLVRKASYRLEL